MYSLHLVLFDITELDALLEIQTFGSSIKYEIMKSMNLNSIFLDNIRYQFPSLIRSTKISPIVYIIKAIVDNSIEFDQNLKNKYKDLFNILNSDIPCNLYSSRIVRLDEKIYNKLHELYKEESKKCVIIGEPIKQLFGLRDNIEDPPRVKFLSRESLTKFTSYWYTGKTKTISWDNTDFLVEKCLSVYKNTSFSENNVIYYKSLPFVPLYENDSKLPVNHYNLLTNIPIFNTKFNKSKKNIEKNSISIPIEEMNITELKDCKFNKYIWGLCAKNRKVYCINNIHALMFIKDFNLEYYGWGKYHKGKHHLLVKSARSKKYQTYTREYLLLNRVKNELLTSKYIKNTNLLNKEDMTKNKEIVHPCFLHCVRATESKYWQFVFEDLAFGKTPYGAYISKGFICCNFKGREFSYKIDDKKPSTELVKEIVNIFTTKLNLQSTEEKEMYKKQFKNQSLKVPLDDYKDWGDIRKKEIRLNLLEKFCLKYAEDNNKTSLECKKLISSILLSLQLKYITASDISLENGEIKSINNLEHIINGPNTEWNFVWKEKKEILNLKKMMLS